MRRTMRWLSNAALLCAAVTARAELIEVVPFSLPVGPSQQTIAIPQFNPAMGTLTGATLTLSGTIQYVLDIFNTGPGPFSVTVHDNLSFAGTPVMTGGTFSGTIPSNQTVFTLSPAALPVGPLTELFGADVAAIFAGNGTVPFDLVLPAVNVDQSSGPSVLNVLAFSGASGNVTVNYMFAPAAAAVPEPLTSGMVGVPLLILALCTLRSAARNNGVSER